MSDEKITPKQQLEALKDFKNTYNTDAHNALQQAQSSYNENLQQERKNDHRTYKAIEAEAQQLLAHAHKEGEIHIRERHGRTPSIFFVELDEYNKIPPIEYTNLKIWDGKKIHEAEFENIQNLDMDKYLSPNMIAVSGYIANSSDTTERGHVIFGNIYNKKPGNSKTEVAGRYNSYITRTGYFSRWSYHVEGTGRKERHVLKYLEIDRTYTVWDMEILPLSMGNVGRGMVLLGEDYIYYPNPPEGNDKLSTDYYANMIRPEFNDVFGPAFASHYDDQKKKVILYLAYKGMIYRKNPTGRIKSDIMLTDGEIGQPIDLVYHSLNHSLLFQDAQTQQICIHLLDEPAKRNWRWGTKSSFFPIPEKAWPNTTTFTISCLLRLHRKSEESMQLFESDLRFCIQDGIFRMEYFGVGVPGMLQVHFPISKHLPDDKNDWFQLTIQKEDQTLSFFVEGVLAHQCEAPLEIVKSKGLNLGCPGYAMCELRIWKVIRTTQQIKTYKRTWLPLDEYDGLTGYWHFYVVGNESPTGLELYNLVDTKDGKSSTVTVIQEPDLSGHGNHIITQKGASSEPGDLNYHTFHDASAPSPFPKVIPLYNLKMIKQGLEIDRNTGKIYWVDKAEDGQTYLMCGSTLGHHPPIPLFQMNSEGKFSVLSQQSSPYEELIIAHGKRRAAMEEQFNAITDVHQNAHENVTAQQKVLTQTLKEQQQAYSSKKETEEKKQQEGNTDNSSLKAYQLVHDEWQQTLNQMNIAQENLVQAAKKSHEEARKKAKNMTDQAIKKMIENRKSNGRE